MLEASPEELPLALAELHRATPVGDVVRCTLRWPHGDDALVDVVVGAGFVDVRVSGDEPRVVEAVRARTLPDTVGPGMRLLVCGLNPSLHAADAGVGFVTPSNRF
ncbi:MAG TPA: hypothetical protein VFV42_11955, partial [Acidimicrobiales bacterium]|nr:hypothetical protein [Acidimicrobiales bacterium]